ncbi:hypothetical protein [Psychrobacter sp. ANT_WB68]|uniref:hypothetical protein n=1 Tax=Psychrobacter sp. ANT_WB68 TaxID=2597355 RepID=UPI0011F1F745|nr:hypothetical protein [Psychrobacter sp. ANT_WB68]KAA0913097.1 hypothetical protein FQ084_11440 [Psychrobacter sp. ANT_WB68]
MNIKLSISLLLFLGVLSGCSKNTDSVDTANTSIENVAEEQIPIEDEVETDLEAVEIDDSEVNQTPEDGGVVEGMGHDYSDPYYTKIINDSGNEVQDDLAFEERGDIISDEFAADHDDGVVEGMGHDYNDPYYTDR